jgi:uncharacterized membrane protein
MRSLRVMLIVAAVAGLLCAGQAVLASNCTLTYANFGQAFLGKYCNTCHASTLSGGQRRGAPAGLDFDTPELAAKHAVGIMTRTAVKKNMPPAWAAPQPTDDERTKVQTWVSCEYPR